jgi:hypothetical protein
MKILKGNIWDWYEEYNHAICITTNGIIRNNGKLVMGAGIAKQAADKINGLDTTLGRLVKWYGNKPFYLPDINIMSFPTKYDWRKPSDLSLILWCASVIKEMIEFYELPIIYSPIPGCGNGGLNKDMVLPELVKIWDSDKFVIVEH